VDIVVVVMVMPMRWGFGSSIIEVLDTERKVDNAEVCCQVGLLVSNP